MQEHDWYGGIEVERFLARRRKDWRALQALLDRLDASGQQAISLHEAARLGALYRAACSDLLTAQSSLMPAEITDFLNALVARAYGHLYCRESRPWTAMGRFLRDGFPKLVREERRLVWAALIAMALGGIFGALLVGCDPAALPIVIPEMHQSQTPSERVREEALRGLATTGDAAVFSSLLFTHNIQVTFLVFALGISFGIGTALTLFWNGVPLGALAVQYHRSGEGLFFWAWILPHGVLELTVVAIAGASGFVLSRALWRPGSLTRSAALAKEAKRAVLLVAGGMPLLVIAGMVEGTLSQMHSPVVPAWIKLTFAAALFAATLTYLAQGGRRQPGPGSNTVG